MSVNVQLANELRRLSGDNLTTSQIMLALGYTPANDTEFLAHARSSAIHVTEEDRKRWNLNSGNSSCHGNYYELDNAPNIFDDGSAEYNIVDPYDNIIVSISNKGVSSVNFWIGNQDIVTYVRQHLGTFDYDNLTNKPGFSKGANGTTICYDQNGSRIGEFDSYGLTIKGLKVDGIDILQKINNIQIVSDYEKLTNIPPIHKGANNSVIYKDTTGAILTEIGATGIKTNNLFVGGQSIAAMIAASAFSGDYNLLYNKPNIEESEDRCLLITDNNGNIVAEINEHGIRAIAFYSGHDGTDLSSSVKSLQQTSNQHLADTNIHVTTIDKENWNATKNSFSAHSANGEIHVTTTNKKAWDAKSNFSGLYADLIDKPNINQEASGSIIFKDKSGNELATLTAAGALYANFVFVGGERVNLFERIVSNETLFSTHNTDEQRHISLAERTSWNTILAHAPDSIIHITNEERIKWNSKSSFSGSYLDLLDKPEITKDAADDSFIVADNSGNKIFQVGNDGAHVFNLFIRGDTGNDIDIKQALGEKAPASHTHSYAGSLTPGGVATAAQQLYFSNSTVFTWNSNIPIQIIGVFCMEITINGSEVVQFFLRADNSVSTLTTPYFFSEARKQWLRFSFTRDSNNLWSRSMLYYLGNSNTPVAVEPSATNYPTIKVYYNTK